MLTDEEDVAMQFNAAFGDGFGDVVRLSKEGINILLMKSDLRCWCLCSQRFFVAYCANQYDLASDISKRIQLTLRNEIDTPEQVKLDQTKAPTKGATKDRVVHDTFHKRTKIKDD
jgi:hypothetical protein